MAERITAEGKKINSIFRRSELKFVFLFTFLFSFVIIGIINFFVILISSNIEGSSITYPFAYINSIADDVIFNYIVMSIFFVFLSMIYSYYLFIESKIHFKNRKYYLTVNDNFSNIFNIPLSIIFGILIALFFFFSLLNITRQINPSFKPLPYTAFLLSLLIIISFIFYSYFYLGIRRLTFNLLNLYNSVASSLKKDLDDAIYNSRLNSTPLWLVVFEIINLNEESRKIKKGKNLLAKVVVQELKRFVRTADFVILCDVRQGIISYIIDNEEKKIKPFIDEKIIPFLKNNISYKNVNLEIRIKYKIEDLLKNEDVVSVKDLITESKKIIRISL